MAKRYKPVKLVRTAVALSLVMAWGCTPQFHKDDADKEVYKIIDSKWKNDFGLKVNYIVADSNIPSPNDVIIDKNLVQSELITLAQAVAVATKYNREYQSRKESLYLSALALTGERYKYALKWFGTIDYDYENIGENPQTSTVSSEVGVSKTFLTPQGILFSPSLVLDWARLVTGDPRTTLGSVLRATIDVPLLGNGGGKVDWENLTQAERDVLYEIRTFNRFRQTFVVSIINDYYNVLQQRDNVNNTLSNWKSSVEYRKQAELEGKIGRTPTYQVDQARQRELVSYNNYVTTAQRYEQVLDLFKVRLTIPPNMAVELDQNELLALRNVATGEPNVTVDAAIDTALVCRLDLANSYDSVEDAQRRVKLASEGLGVQLNLTASTDVRSEPDKNYDNLMFDRGIYTFNASADLPFDRKNQRNAYRQELITLERQQREYSDNVDLVMLGVRQAYRQYIATAEQYRTQEKSLALAEERVKNMPVLLKTLRAQTRDLLDAQDSLLQAQTDLTSALIGHTMAKLNFFRDVGILQVKPDGMWEQTRTAVSRNQTNEREPDEQSSENNL